MTINWSTTSQATQVGGVKMLVYADAGAGKTVLCATLPRPVVISAEAGLLSLQKKNLERLFGVGNPTVTYDIPVMQVTTIDQLTEAYNFFANPANRAQEHFGSIALDSLTEIAEVVLANEKKGTKDPRQAYGTLIDKVDMIVRFFRDLAGYHIYMSAKMEPHKDELTGVTRFMPAMPGSKLGPKLPYYFDEVFRLGINRSTDGSKYRYLQTDGDLQYVAKDRSGVLDEMERPDLTYIINKILGV